MMRKLMALLTALTMALALGSAQAEIFVDAEKPADWAERPLFRLIIFSAHASDSMLAQCGGETMLIDGGVRQHYPKLSAALDELGVAWVNYMYNSHPHDDHIGAQNRLVTHDLLGVGEFLTPFPETYRNTEHMKMVPLLREKGIPYRQLHTGDVQMLGGAAMTFYRYDEGNDPNELSGVWRVTFGDCSIFLPSDLSGVGQHWFAAHYTAEELGSDILKGPHHGLTNMAGDFLDMIAPEVVIFTNSKVNTPDETRQVIHHGAEPMYNEGGRITLETDGVDWYITKEKGVY